MSYKQIARITKQTHWNILKGSRVLNDRVEFKGLCNILPGRNGPVFEAKTVSMNSCNKKFVDHWLKPSIYPRAEHIVINSDVDPSVLRRFPNASIAVTWTWKYKPRVDNANIEIIDDNLFEIWSSMVHETEPLYIVPK